MEKRKSKRHLKRLEVDFSVHGSKFKGISSNISEEGIFIRTRQGFAPGTILNIEIHLPEDRIAKMKGRVIRTARSPLQTEKNGMGIEFIIKDALYTDFLKSLRQG